MNQVVLIGRLTRDPELRYIPGTGTAVCKFNIAVNRNLSREKKEEAESKNQPTADFINITVFGKIAENAANYLSKGRQAGIQGRIQTGSYDKDGTRIYTTEVLANNVEFLEWGDSSNKSNSSSEFDSSQNTGFSGIEGFNPVDNDDIPF